MNALNEELYTLVKDVLTREDYDIKIKEIQNELGGLVNDECAAFLLVDMIGKNCLPYSNLSEVHDGEDSSFFLTVDEIIRTRTIATKNSQCRISELLVSDGSRKCKLVLLGKHAEVVEDGLVSRGCKLKVVNAHVKINENELELTLGWWGAVEVNPEVNQQIITNVKTSQRLKEVFGLKFARRFYDIETLSTLSEKTVVCINATITDMKKMRKFIRKDGGEGKVANLKIDDGTGSVDVVLWGSAADFVDGLEIGDNVEVSKVRIKKNENGLELHSITGTSIKKLNINQ